MSTVIGLNLRSSMKQKRYGMNGALFVCRSCGEKIRLDIYDPLPPGWSTVPVGNAYQYSCPACVAE